MDMKVIVWSEDEDHESEDYDEDLDIDFLAREELLATADIVTLNVPLSEKTNALVNK